MATTVPRSLIKYGCDYTVLGYTGIIGVERKSWGDWINSIRGRNWSRFRKSLDKLRKHRFPLIVVEGRMSDYIIYSNIGTVFVAYRTAQIVTGGIPVIYADNPQIAETVCWEFFQHSIKRLNSERNHIS